MSIHATLNTALTMVAGAARIRAVYSGVSAFAGDVRRDDVAMLVLRRRPK